MRVVITSTVSAPRGATTAGRIVNGVLCDGTKRHVGKNWAAGTAADVELFGPGARRSMRKKFFIVIPGRHRRVAGSSKSRAEGLTDGFPPYRYRRTSGVGDPPLVAPEHLRPPSICGLVLGTSMGGHGRPGMWA